MFDGFRLVLPSQPTQHNQRQVRPAQRRLNTLCAVLIAEDQKIRLSRTSFLTLISYDFWH